MTYYLFENGDVSDANMVLGNFNELTYAILYNRMENDAQATAPQLNANIQSDLFCCAAGKYSTVCTAETTSAFNTNVYINCVLEIPCYDRCTYYDCYNLCSYRCGINSVCIGQANYDASSTWHYNCTNYCFDIPVNLFDKNYICIYLLACGGGGPSCMSQSSYIVHNKSYFGTYCACGCVSCSCGGYSCPSGGYTCCKKIEYCKINDGIYSIYVDDICVSQTTTNINGFKLISENVLCSRCGNGVCAVFIFNCYSLCFLSKSICNTKIQSNLKTYATPKGSVVLSTIATLPAGNCIRYNIKDQAGTVLLCDASPDAVYSLSSPANCLYAEIYQCVECNLCTPQCMTQYALMYM